MTSDAKRNGHRRLLFPIDTLIFSQGVDRLMREGQLDPMPYLQRHIRGDWGDVTDDMWQENNAALASGEPLGSLYIVTRELTIRIFTEADRSVTHVMLPSES
ncbi:hypothetical protein UXO16_20165 [Enterobacter hormaechei]|uniref:FIG146805: Plasmid related protein n=1 Tax=Enterobacter ludwigii TaxID=299767 RepID=A0AAX3LI56_9ENTR|nr:MULTISPECIES: hypothetical protein [Enterobacter cloacae complex]MCW4755585.1 hypothetical protein [Enterobacter hormaechei]WCE15942.1 hypothetical protein PHA72_26735 [Enterobacter ludwigii]